MLFPFFDTGGNKRARGKTWFPPGFSIFKPNTHTSGQEMGRVKEENVDTNANQPDLWISPEQPPKRFKVNSL